MLCVINYLNGGILDDIEIWRYLVKESIEYDKIEIIREGKECWYKNLYK